MLGLQTQSRPVALSASQLLTSLVGVQIDKCFGFESAVEESQRALLAGYVEAASAKSGLGLIKLMGRQSGYIAMQASMASGQLLPAAPCLPVCLSLGACLEDSLGNGVRIQPSLAFLTRASTGQQVSCLRGGPSAKRQ